MAYSVFDVAARLFRLSGVESISAVKLQKLMYYGFGWYGRLTGEKLFTQHFYAMEHGPVVGELLTLHKYRQEVDRDLVEQGRDIIEDPAQVDDPYLGALLEAVWQVYGGISRWRLVEMTHREPPWLEAWRLRREGSKRANLDSDAIIEFYLKRRDVPLNLAVLLPDSRVSFMPPAVLDQVEAASEAAAGLARGRFREAGLLN